MYTDSDDMEAYYREMLEANIRARDAENIRSPYSTIAHSGRALASGLEIEEFPIEYGLTHINDPRSEYTADEGKVSVRVKRG
jgi:hypothetical protein